MEKELVWAELRGMSPWPGMVCTPDPNVSNPNRASSKWIFFFGCKIYRWVEEQNMIIHPYVEHREAIVKTIKVEGLKKAVEHADRYLAALENYKSNAEKREYTVTAFHSHELETSTPLKEPKATTKQPVGNNGDLNETAFRCTCSSPKDVTTNDSILELEHSVDSVHNRQELSSCPASNLPEIVENGLVWATMSGWPPWPGTKCTPDPSLTENVDQSGMEWIFLFGSKKIYHWFKKDNLKPYVENRVDVMNTIKVDCHKCHLIWTEAVKSIDEYLNDAVTYKANADLPAPWVEEREDTVTASNELLENNESPELETPAPAKESKATTKRAVNSGSSAETAPKRPRPSPKDESKIDSTSEFEPNVQNYSELNRPQVLSCPVSNLLDTVENGLVWHTNKCCD